MKKIIFLFFIGLLFFNLFSREIEVDDEYNKRCEKEIKKVKIDENSIILGYSVSKNSIYPAFVLKNSVISGTEIIPYDVNEMYNLFTGKRIKVDVVPAFNPLGEDRCVSFAETKDTLEYFSLFATKKISLRKPDNKEKEFFYSINKECVVVGDDPVPVPCTKPEVVAVSDFNSNGLSEFWVKSPYIWGFGLYIFEKTKDGKSLKKLEYACFFCD